MSKKFIVDGIEFQNKSDYRDYMITTYFSFKNKSIHDEGPFIKKPGDINGQPFEMSDCNSCSLIVMDYTEQVQIDQLKSCKVFLGACSSSTFIRDCSNCIFYICTRQLRLRDCHNCIIYNYSQSEIHIELSSKLQFGPFHGGYAKQGDHFISAGLEVEKNLWYDIFDHNDPNKTRSNWSLLTDYGDPWFPDGSNVRYVPITSPKLTESDGNDSGQVGESYGFHQLVADSMKTTKDSNHTVDTKVQVRRHRNIDKDVELLGEEISLLVVYAEAQGNNLLDILAKDGNSKGITSATNFIHSLLQLTISISTEADESTRMELETATSETSLKMILELCREDTTTSSSSTTTINENNDPQIDVHYFLKLCKKKYAMLTEDLESEPDVINPVNDLSFSIPNSMVNNKSRYSITSGNSSSASGTEWQYTSREEKSSVTSISGIPRLPPESGSTLSIAIHDHHHTSSGNDSVGMGTRIFLSNSPGSPIKIPTETMIPSSPYDEEIKFSDDDIDDLIDDDDEIDVDGINHSNRKSDKNKTDTMEYKSKVRQKLSDGIASGISSSSMLFSKDNYGDKPTYIHEEFESLHFSSSPNSKAITRMRSHSSPKLSKSEKSGMDTNVNKSNNTNNPVDIKFIESISNEKEMGINGSSKLEKHLLFMQDLVETQIRNTVYQTDLYHKIQVHLGFIDAYTMVPARGEIVISKPRPWLSIRDITLAFYAGRLRLNHFQVQIVILLVSNFAQEFRVVEKSSVVNQSMNSKKYLSNKIVVKDGPLLNALWLKKYLASLRSSKLSKLQSSIPTPNIVTTASYTTTVDKQPNRTRSLSRGSMDAKNATKNYRSSSVGPRQRSASMITNFSSVSLISNRRHKSMSRILNREGKAISDNNINVKTMESNRVIPIQWEEWLGMKVLDDKSKQEEKPKEFRRALAGLPSTLSKNEMNHMIEKFQIIPEEILLEEIQSRVRRWVLDIDGRRDFRHEINLEIRKWQLKEKTHFNKLSKDKRKIILTTTKQKLTIMKTEELKMSEKMDQNITKELFWKYRDECTERNYQGTSKWGVWLQQYRIKSDDAIKKIQENIEKRRELSKIESSQKEAVIPIQEICNAINNVTSNGGLPISNSLELRKSFVALRKETAKLSSTGDSHGISNYSILVSRGDFDRHLEPALAPLYNKLPEEMKKLADQAKFSHDELLRSSSKFYQDHKEAAQRAVELEAELSSKKSDTFKKWLKTKKVEQIKAQQDMEEAMKKKEQEKEEKKKKGEAAYQKWLKNRKKNKYISKVDNSTKMIPSLSFAHHTGPWKQELDAKSA